MRTVHIYNISSVCNLTEYKYKQCIPLRFQIPSELEQPNTLDKPSWEGLSTSSCKVPLFQITEYFVSGMYVTVPFYRWREDGVKER